MDSIRRAAQDAVEARLEFKIFKNLMERNYLIEFLKKHNWNQQKTSKAIGVHRNTMTRMLKTHNIELGED